MTALEKMISAGENSKVEFKSSFNQETIESVCAFANKKGGTIFIGLKSREKILGLQVGEESVQNWLNEIKSKTDPAQIPDVELMEYRGKTLVALTVRESAIKPVAVQGRCFMRRENSNHVMSPVEISDAMLQTQNSSWDYVLDESGSMEDVSLEKIERSIERINSRGYHLPMDAVEFLRKNRLLREDKLTFAAEMLFAKDWHMNTAVQMGFFQSPTIIRDRDEAHGDLVSQVEQVFGFVKKHINCAVVISGKPENDLVWDYPLDALRELVLNMIVHRDYRSPSESCVKVFQDHIEFFNPGKLPDDMTVDDLVNGRYLSTLRNKAIANHFHQLGEIEKYGSGVTRVIRLFRAAGLRDPKFEMMGAGVRVTVFARDVDGQASGRNTPETTENTTEKTTENTTEKILEALRRNPDATTQMLAEQFGITADGVYWHVKKLKTQGKIRRIGGDRGGHWEVLS